jgi:hypothetical protein
MKAGFGGREAGFGGRDVVCATAEVPSPATGRGVPLLSSGSIVFVGFGAAMDVRCGIKMAATEQGSGWW